MNLTIKQIVFLVSYSLVCFFGSLAFVQCSEKSAQNRIQGAVTRAEVAEANVCTLKDENDRLRVTIVRANDAVERALIMILEAQDGHEKRIDAITHDPAAADWLACDIPDSVREAFADYYRDGVNDSP